MFLNTFAIYSTEIAYVAKYDQALCNIKTVKDPN